MLLPIRISKTTDTLKMIILPIINFVLPLMLTCLVLIDDPPRCSECRKKMEINVIENKKDEFTNIANTDEFNENPFVEKYRKSKSYIW